MTVYHNVSNGFFLGISRKRTTFTEDLPTTVRPTVPTCEKRTENIIQEQNKTINKGQQNHRTNTPDIFHIQWISQCLEYHMPWISHALFPYYYTWLSRLTQSAAATLTKYMYTVIRLSLKCKNIVTLPKVNLPMKGRHIYLVKIF